MNTYLHGLSQLQAEERVEAVLVLGDGIWRERVQACLDLRDQGVVELLRVLLDVSAHAPGALGHLRELRKVRAQVVHECEGRKGGRRPVIQYNFH